MEGYKCKRAPEKSAPEERLQQAGTHRSFLRPEAEGQLYKWDKHM